MITLQNCQKSDVQHWGHDLYSQYIRGLANFEEAATIAVKSLYEDFITPTGDPLFALVRIFRVTAYDDLPPDLKKLTDPDIQYWIALAGTYGQEQNWCDRHQSVSHGVLSAEHATPMLKAALKLAGVKWGSEASDHMPDPHNIAIEHYFYIPNAPHHEDIPDQENFILRYGIQSVIGIGSPFMSQSAYLAVMFSKMPINQTDCNKLIEIAPYLSTLLASYDARNLIWSA